MAEQRPTIIDHLQTQLQAMRPEAAENDDGKNFESALSPKQRRVYERKMRILKMVGEILRKENITGQQVRIEQLGEQELGKTEGRMISIDPVVMKDEEILKETLVHEAGHAKGIHNEGLNALVTAKKIGRPLETVGEETYADEIKDVRKVTDVIGIESAQDQYQSGNFSILYRFFKTQAKQQNEKITDEEIDGMFSTAFPELQHANKKPNTSSEQSLSNAA